MNFLHIFAVVALILALATGQIEAKGRRRGGGGGNKGHYIRAGAHVAGKAVEGVGAAVVEKIG